MILKINQKYYILKKSLNIFKKIRLYYILKNRILELDDIDDWVYNQYGYESNKAKLRISCEFEKRVDTNNININVTLLGVLRPLLYGGVTQN